jgi:hypothetical protein
MAGENPSSAEERTVSASPRDHIVVSNKLGNFVFLLLSLSLRDLLALRCFCAKATKALASSNTKID